MPIFWFCLTIIIGIFMASIIKVPILYWYLASLIILFSIVFECRIFREKKHPLISNPIFKIPFTCLILGLCIGGMRYKHALPLPSRSNPLRYINNDPVSIIGLVNTDPNRSNDFTTAVVKIESITIDSKNIAVDGNMSLVLPAGYGIRYGDRLQISGKLSKTYENDLNLNKSYLAQKKIFTQMAFPEIDVLSFGNGNRIISFIYKFREKAHTIIFNFIPFPESAILSGILLGIETEIPDYLWDSYQATGTVHIIAISGFNITIISLLAFHIFHKILGWDWALPVTICVIILYTFLVGADPPVVRAAIMGIIALTGRQIGRRSISLYTLTLAAATMLLVNPFLLWSVSFQLSFLATLALIIVVDPVETWIKLKGAIYFSEDKLQLFFPILSLCIATFSVIVVIFPVLYKISPDLSTVSLLANFIIAPVQPAIMIFGGLAVISGFFISPNLNIFGMIVWPLIYFCNQIAIRLSMSNSAIFPISKVGYWISLFISIFLVVYFVYQNIISLSRPKIVYP
jgi:competence protein ComEC